MGGLQNLKAMGNSRDLAELSNKFHTSMFTPTSADGNDGDIWFKIPDVLPVANCIFNFDASKLVLSDNADVSAWADETENNNDLALAATYTPAKYLKTGLNGRPTVQFNEATLLTKTSFTLPSSDGFTHFFVLELKDLDSNNIMDIMLDGGGYATSFRLSGSGDNYSSGVNNGDSLIGSEAITALEPTLVTVSCDGTNHILYINGVLIDSAAFTANLDSHDTLAVGARTTGVNALNGNISHIAGFPILTQAEIASMTAYLKEKWGIE